MTQHDEASDARADRARDIGLYRYALIREPADPALSTRQRGMLVRELAGTEHTGPFGERVVVSRVTLDRWIRAWRAGGFDALMPSARYAEPRTAQMVLDLAAALKREVPARTAAHVGAILAAHAGTAPSERTLQRLFVRLELNTRPDGMPPKAFGRFEAAAPNDRWTGDALHGPVVGGRKTYLFAFIDDHSRAIVGYRWGHSEDTVRLEAALRAGLAARGIPQTVYVDNGSAFVAAPLLRALASLGIRLTHSRPRQPAGRGKIERFFRTVREQFLVELAVPGALDAVGDLTRMNDLFAGWVETVYHRRVHSETGQAPLERFLAPGPPALPTPAALREAFLWSQRRTVTKTATFSLHGNIYEVDAALVGRRIEVVFDPFDLTALDVRFQGRPMGIAVPHKISRHVHPGAHPETAPAPPVATGIDYLALVADQHHRELATRINYTDLPTGDRAGGAGEEVDAALEAELAGFAALGRELAAGALPGQLDLADLTDFPRFTPEPTNDPSDEDPR
ncbi:DDE-type integrase/transposase/recombinase [Pengzhenrongella sp.]|uniref:DDE-type integrase/transposase/recombinase n=1 Tax=Pengzhenrongella sp. TaxID=2888820 RepID=UPI002F95F96F